MNLAEPKTDSSRSIQFAQREYHNCHIHNCVKAFVRYDWHLIHAEHAKIS